MSGQYERFRALAASSPVSNAIEPLLLDSLSGCAPAGCPCPAADNADAAAVLARVAGSLPNWGR